MTTRYMLESSDELRTHSLQEYKTYLEKLKLGLTGEVNITILKGNWESFKNAKDFMKPPHTFIDEEDYIDTSNRPTEEQQLSAKKINEQIELLRSTVYNRPEFTPDELTFSQDSTEIAKQYIASIHSFEDAQDSFFQGFLTTNTETKNLDDYFKETLLE